MYSITKEDILQEASASFRLQDQVLAFKDGSEVPEDFNLLQHMKQTTLTSPPEQKLVIVYTDVIRKV